MFSPEFCKQRVKIKIAKGTSRTTEILTQFKGQMAMKMGYVTIKVAFVYNSKGCNRDFTIIQRVHSNCKGYCTLHKKHRENAGMKIEMAKVAL